MENKGINKVDTILRDATLDDLLYIDTLRKREGSALGFIPKAAYESILSHAPVDGRRRWIYSRLLVTQDGTDLTGFCYVSFSDPFAKVFQIVVQEDARRWKRAMLMIDEIERQSIEYGKFGVTCRVAYDLDSNFFWRAIGYVPLKQVTSTWLNQKESKSKRPLWIYEKVLQNKLMSVDPNPVLLA